MFSTTREPRAAIPSERPPIAGRSLAGPESAAPDDSAISPRTLTSRDLYQEVCRRLKRKGYAWD
jgi:hypothetical protein